MNRVLILIGISFLVSLSCDDPSGIEPKRPNIVFLLADDMGYGDYERIGGSTETPNLNRLADEEIFLIIFMLQDLTASRAGLMTGKSHQSGMYSYRPQSHPLHLPKEITLAELLKTRGYQTAILGNGILEN